MIEGDKLAKVLHVDLTDNRFWVEDRRELFEKYLGGTGVAIRLLEECCSKGADPLGPENVIVLAVGPLTGRYPLASKTVALFKSPHTGDLGESHCGGRSAVAIRMAGFGAIVIRGRSRIPVYLSIRGGNVEFRNATTLWGMSSVFTAGRIIRERESGAGMRTIMRIGRAGEKLVSCASVMTETYRHFGRLGLGAVFGSKHLKAVVVSGRDSFPVTDPKLHKSLYKEIYDSAVDSPVMQKYHDLGTASNILPLNEMGGLPTRNLTAARFEGAERISGEHLAENYLGRRLACAHCPVACIHIAALREPYEDEPYFYKTSMICYDYEPIFAIGAMLGISDPEAFLKLMDRVESRGVDVMSIGVILAWATEAFEKGIIDETQTAGIRLQWGALDAYMRAVDLIVDQPNEFYAALAKGAMHASARYGGEEMALCFGGNEMPGYHTGPAAALGHAIGARHSHLDNAGYSLDQKVLLKEKQTPEQVIDQLVAEERWRQILSSLVICFFARGLYSEEIVLRSLGVSGFDLTSEDLRRIGEEIYAAKFAFKIREGFTLKGAHLARRIFETPTPVETLSEEYLRKGLAYFSDKILGVPIE
jgi:aldehyde:ferredoxin oxidoreductase